MATLRFPFLAAALFAAGAVLAQTSAPNRTPPDVGPFPPQPGDDPSLLRTLPPEAYQPPAPPQPAPAQASAGVPAAAATAAPAPVIVVVPDANRDAAAQEQLERARLEAEAARARMSTAPAPINGAFTGLTDERNR
ncbi:MAG TPA: hypothetical protein VLS49_15470 [Usitatibacter sp.]|nr:hypothetical protein [Usitatibacter sp.]